MGGIDHNVTICTNIIMKSNMSNLHEDLKDN